MIDFLMIATRTRNRGPLEIYPKFIIKKSSDLMIRGGDFYAIWLEDRGLWSTDEQDALQLIDRELDIYAEKHKETLGTGVKVLHMWDAESGMIDSWHKYCQKQMRDSFHMLDEKLIFSNTPTNKKDYASKRLSYPLEVGHTDAYDQLMSVLYSEEERHKLEWAIGSIVSGDSKKLQKFMVLYGAAGTGKSTVLNIIQQLFEGYYSVFDAKALGSSSNAFALEAFKSNPLVAIQHDGDLSHIEDNTRLNSLVSHELMTVNEKFKSTYANRFKCFLFMGTNKPVKITDAKSGLIRRLIDVSPSGEKVSAKEYRTLVQQIGFELGAIASHCLDIYQQDPNYYDDYIPIQMLGASNDFYNFVVDSYHVFKKEDGVSLKAAWEMYKTYCDEAKIAFPFSQRVFKEELKNYFREFKERFDLGDGSRVRSYYSGFRVEKFEDRDKVNDISDKPKLMVNSNFVFTESIIDHIYADCLAQYANKEGTPLRKWDSVHQKLSSINTSRLHYVKIPENHIVIDFDIPDENGEKSFELNCEAANKWPATYAELSKSGKGIHLHYIYTGDVSKLSRVFADHIEIKVFTGNSSLRRALSKCNNHPITTINSGLPTKGEKKVVNFDAVQSEKGLRAMIEKNLRKEIHPATKPSMDFIYKILDDAYKSGLHYDVSDMRQSILIFASHSTNQADYCMKLVSKMKLKSEEASDALKTDDSELIFYDVEVFPNLFLVNWKRAGERHKIHRLINPKPEDIEKLIKLPLVGFNCRRYDNHILYACLMGYSNEELYRLSKRIINGGSNCFFGEAYNISYTDIYDFCSKKQSLKKWEIELGIHHKELGLDWDTPVPEGRWKEVAEYCDNDVIATEAVFNARKADWLARQILADIAGMTVNDTTNSLSTRIIFGKNRKPQDQFNYRFMGDVPENANGDVFASNGYFYPSFNDPYTLFDEKNRPVFQGYKFEKGVSTYRGEEVGEGGYVYAEPGIYYNVALLDIASMHPSSAIAEELFGKEYTKRFEELRDARVAIKHREFDKAREMLNGALSKYLTDENVADDLAQALKIVINSVYGLTSASFDNPFRDKRNIDNIVAKRGALFMVNLKHMVQEKGFTVAHIKTDSIKIPNATPEIIEFVKDYGAAYGYTFEHEATYDRMCLVNDAVYIAKYKNGKHAGEWTATGTQFAVPYVYKTLFSKENITLDDMCETKSVSSALYLDVNEDLMDVSEYEKELHERTKVLYEYGDERKLNPNFKDLSEDDLRNIISQGHNYQFVGKVGQFCPVKPGCGGGLLMRQTNDGGYAAANGTKGYRWKESEVIRELNLKDQIDKSYYNNLVNDAVETISKYGDFEQFVASDTEIDIYPPLMDGSDVMPWELPCKTDKYETCIDCPHFHADMYSDENEQDPLEHYNCDLGYDIPQDLILPRKTQPV